MKLVDRLAAWAATDPPWWMWPTLLVVLAVASFAAALFLQPTGGEFVNFPGGTQFGETCAVIQITGKPCPQCGMTRAFVYGARGAWLRAADYNPAGLALFLWLQAGGVVGLARLITRDKSRLEPPLWLLFGWTVVWMIVYAVGWFARLADVHPLPV